MIDYELDNLNTSEQPLIRKPKRDEPETYEEEEQPQQKQEAGSSGEVLTIKTRSGAEVHLGSYTHSLHELVGVLLGMIQNKEINDFINSNGKVAKRNYLG